MKDDINTQELNRLAEKICNVDLKSDEEANQVVQRLVDYAKSKDIIDYIFHPKPGDPQKPTAEQIVAKVIELRNARPNVFLMPPPKSPSKA